MKWTSAISESLSLDKAVKECAAGVISELGSDTPDLVMAFVSSSHYDNYDKVPKLLTDNVKVKHLIGCSGGGVIGGGREVENRPGFALTAASLPGVEITPFHVDDGALPSLDDSPSAWEDLVQVSVSVNPQFVLLPEPFTIQADNLLMGLDYAFTESVKIGGLASGGQRPGANALYMEQEVYRSGAVGVAMHGNIRVETIVAQGCRPIGGPLVVTRCQGNIVYELDSGKSMDVLQEMFEAASDEDRRLMTSALHLGVVMDPLKEAFQPGDFLIRNVMGLHKETGALIVGEMLREGQVVQFHVRDNQAAKEDLEAMIDRYLRENGPEKACGALLFSCVGRGEHLFGRPNHDTNIFQSKVSDVPLAGFFCNGEIGPVGGTTFLHGFTSSFAIFTPAHDSVG
ncbi:MAG: FIST N-terminal domain-containing protein [Dehalococcoidia bacterium]